MHVLLDHITAFIVASVLFVSIFTMINRSRQNAVEMQIGQMVHEQAYDFARVLERDLENIRSESQVIQRNSFLEPDIDNLCGYEVDTDGRNKTIDIPNPGRSKAGRQF